MRVFDYSLDEQSQAAEHSARRERDDASSSSSSEDEEDEASKQLWAKVEGVLEEYHLSRFALAAAKRWVRLMGYFRPHLHAHLAFCVSVRGAC
jgi:hypothetical protein